MAKEKLLLFAPRVSPRLRYIASHIVSEMLGASIEFLTNREEAKQVRKPLINYSTEPVPFAVNVFPGGLLDESHVSPHKVEVEMHNNIPVIYRSGSADDTGFDLFSASFYMLSRYEEYLSSAKDRHGRFPFGESLAGRSGLAGEPLVELWAGELMKCIQRKFPNAVFPERKFRFIPTIDIDIPWAYRNRSLWRTAGGAARSLIKGDFSDIKTRMRVLSGLENDPYDTWHILDKVHESAGLSPVIFFSAGTYSRFDKSPPLSSPGYRRLIEEVSGKHATGIHPSYYTFRDGRLMNREISRLSEITGKPVRRSRQHFLRYEVPVTCRLLIENGISDDYTMGWAEEPGFRAGTCTPFMFYDLEREETTSLRIWPFQIMDGTLRDYMNIDPGHASEIAGGIVKKVRDAGGTLITLWHNESLCEAGRWKNWSNLYFNIVKSAVS